MQINKSIADFFEETIDIFALFGLIFVICVLFGALIFNAYNSNLSATDQQLLDAKSKCPQIRDYLPRDSIATQSSLNSYVQKCEDDLVISKQQAVLR